MGCFGMPFGCEDDRSCDVLLSYFFNNDTFDSNFTISASNVLLDSYISFALSNDDIMGSDFVFICNTWVLR